MDDAAGFVGRLAEFEARHELSKITRTLPRRASAHRLVGRLTRVMLDVRRRSRGLKVQLDARRRDSTPPADPFAYVMAPKKPRPPYLRGAAVADLPD